MKRIVEDTEPEHEPLCRLPEYRPTIEQASVWESHTKELPSIRQERLQEARILCRRCPALEWCEERLSSYERAGMFIDGIVAARFSDVTPPYKSTADMYQAHCVGCECELIPQRLWSDGREASHQPRDHVGEGLCRQCFPNLSRAARQSRLKEGA